MDFLHSQIGKMVEEVKSAMVAKTPVVYIPTDQIEVVNEMLFGENTSDAIVPRVCYKNEGREKGIVRLFSNETLDNDGRSITDNIKVGSIPNALSIPSIIVLYVSDWSNVVSQVKGFIFSYMGLKKSSNYESPEVMDATWRSLCIVVTPREQRIPPELASYVKTVRVPALTDGEIAEIVKSHITREGIAETVIDNRLMNQMIVSFRGLSAYRIHQMLSQMVAQQSIDFNFVDTVAVLDIIRESKKQMLENSQGLKWEKNKVSGVAGLDSISQWLHARKGIFRDPESAIRQHIDIPKGLLVSGVPGSGKSLMAKTAATILEMPLISLDMGALLGGLVGESEHNMIHALEMAEQMAPCVLWIDEIEKAFSGSSQDSSASDGGVGRRMFGKFLTWMQEKSAACFVFATSNDITSLPPELFRSERFDRKYFTFMPTADECARIFAANIKAQNLSYEKELSNMSARIQATQAKQLFSSSLEEPSFWLKIINECCSPDMEACLLQQEQKNTEISEGQPANVRYVWKGTHRPKNKLMTGADITSIIREAKFKIHPEPTTDLPPLVIYDEMAMDHAVRSILRSNEFKPYGETNLKDIVKCFLKLHENEFVPASGKCILDFDNYDDDEKVYRHNPEVYDHWDNAYDKALYCTLVGAINHYSENKID